MPQVKRIPVSTVGELVQLDLDEMVQGYRDGYAGDPEPGDNRSLSYWHGWRNGRTDRGGGRTHRPDAAQRALAKDVHAAQEARSAPSRTDAR